MALSDAISATLGVGGLGALVTGIVMVIKTLQQRRVIKADVLDSLSDTAANLAETARLHAERQINSIRLDAERQIDRAVSRAQTAEDRAARAEERAAAAWDAALAAKRESMEANASVRRLTAAIHSPYASVEGLRAMAPLGGSTNGKG